MLNGTRSKKTLWSLGLIAGLAACNGASFSGAGKANGKNTATDTPAATPQINQGCSDQAVVTGAHIVFLLDNSGSMQKTDCQRGWGNTCGAQTNRETAVLESYNALSSIVTKYPSQASALSTVSIGQFTPGRSYGAPNIVAMETRGDSLAQLQNQLMFLRQPTGDTPYLDGTRLAKTLLDQINSTFVSDGKPRVVIMVTDGEPTDRNPAAVLADAQTIRASGAQWFTVMVNNGQTRDQRASVHRNMLMNDYERGRGRQQSNGHWYTSNYPNFDAYFADIMSLPTNMSNQIIEVSSANDLQKVILEKIIATKIECRN